ncbi:DUF2933 domain-containing protein [Paenibacillus pedocola]|uniref:DUF2933 domain-containing protein n=1 Tax=Paenibacillus pedocola TaxID=3242193 RepID=UPI002877EE02|nr:DUF2933 domain-containing protein [Paenibacillus typhae]
MDWSWLAVLICPLMMIFMMFGMRGGHGHGPHKKQLSAGVVEQELLHLKAQNELLQKEVQELKDRAV